MSRPVALSRIQELGVRGRNDPICDPEPWGGMEISADALRALHEALHPTLLLLALAGYQVDEVLMGPPVGGDVLQVTLSPRDAAPLPWAEPWPSGAKYSVFVPLEVRPGLTAQIVPVAATGFLAPHVRSVGARSFVVFDIDSTAGFGAIVDRLTMSQNVVRTELAARIKAAWLDAGADESTTGLLSALQPDFWTFPLLTDDEDLRRQAFWQLGEVLAGAAFADAGSLEAFLLEEAVVRESDQPPSVADRLLELDPTDATNLQRAWNSEAQALWEQTYPDAGQRPPFRASDHRRLSFAELVFDMLNEGLLSLAGYSPPEDEQAYGGFDLRRGDNDPAAGATEWTYGGHKQTQAAGNTTPLPAYIAELRADLVRVGYGPLADWDTDPTRFGAFLESAVREFQVYAAMSTVARVGAPDEVPVVAYPSLATSLVPQANDQPYTGPLCGVLNAETRALVKMWVERDWHCPVVVEARNLTNAQCMTMRDPASTADKRAVVTNRQINAAHQNIWRRDQVTDASLKWIAWDLSRHYPTAPSRPQGVPVVLSKYSPLYWGGSYAEAPHSNWPESEVAPDNILGAYPPAARRHEQAAFWSTFRVIRAVSEVECMGVLDGMNAYDSAILSGGPVHWTLGLCRLENGKAQNAPDDCVIYRGELCPALSYAAADSPGDYHRFFGAFGLQPLVEWADPPTELYSSAHRKFCGWIALQDEYGDWHDPRTERPDTADPGPWPQPTREDYLLAEALHHWHWIYRWQMAPRLWQRLRELMWELARGRLRALLDLTWPGQAFTIGDVFTSEQSVAMLERYHVYSPPWVFGVSDRSAEWGGATAANINLATQQTGGNLQQGFDHVAQVGGNDPTTWGDAEEKRLIDWMLLRKAPDLNKVAAWPVMKSHTGRDHSMQVLDYALEEAPDIGLIAPIVAAPDAEKRVSFTVTDRETPPERLVVTATPANAAMLAASVGHDEGDTFELVLKPPSAASGEVKLTIEARDGRQITKREVFVNVTTGGTLPTGLPAEYAQPDPIGLSPLRDSFELDDAPLFAAPPG